MGLSTGSDSELITQCLSMMPPERFRNKTHVVNTYNTDEQKHVQYEDRMILNPPSPPASPKQEIRRSKSTVNREQELLARLLHMMSLTTLSYSLLIMYDDSLYAIRDPFGNRPLCIGMLFTLPVDVGSRTSQEKLSIDGNFLL